MNIQKILFLFLLLGLANMAQAQGKAVVTAEVAVSAQTAVQKLGQEMMKGNFEYGQKRMYPRWKRRLAKRYGGMEKLEAALAAAAQQKIKMRFAVVDYKAERPVSFFSVWKTKKFDPVTKKLILDAAGKPIIVEHWLAIVPTTVQVRLPDPEQGGRLRTLEEKGYSLAISEKGANNWYFMTGLKPTIHDLRGLFPTLPPNEKELGLPKPSVREIK